MRNNHLGRCGAEILGSALPRMKGVQRLRLQQNELCIPPGSALTMCVTMRRYMEMYAKLMDLLGVVWMSKVFCRPERSNSWQATLLHAFSP